MDSEVPKLSSPILALADWLLAISAGIALPLLDHSLIVDRYFLRYIIYAYATAASCHSEYLKRLIGALIVTGRFSRHPLFPGRFVVFGVWQFVQFCIPMWTFIRGVDPDQSVFDFMGHKEGCLYLYFGPTVAFFLIRFLWPFRYHFAITFASSFAALLVCPNPWRDRIIWKLLQMWIWTVRLQNRYDLAIHDILARTHEAITTPFDRWEANIARRRRTDPYHYQPLKKSHHIRLLRLNRRSLFSEPSCKLIEVSLYDAPAFEAISYTWGVKPPHIPLKVNGCQLKVTSAVEELLFYQRSMLGSKLFWIDAICINQNDNDEKTHQLPLMTKIYQRASRVIVWLGAPENPRDTLSIRKIIKVLDHPQLFVSTTALLAMIFEKEEEAFLAIAKVLEHPWFERMWVVQEVAMGKKVHIMCQGNCIDWDIFINATKRLGHDGDLMRRLHYYTGVSKTRDNKVYEVSRKGLHVPKVEHLRWTQLANLTMARQYREGNARVPLVGMLPLAVPFKATNPRDNIFALLGISVDRHKLPFKPDYKMDVCEVFLKTTAYVLSTEDWFMLFSMTGRGYDSLRSLNLPPSQPSLASPFKKELPSWVPDYSSDFFAGVRPPLTSGMEAADPDGKVTFTTDDKIIAIQAVEFDKIETVGPGSKIREGAKYFLPSGASTGTCNETGDPEQDKSPTGSYAGDWYAACKRLIHDSQKLADKSEETRDQEFWALCMCQKEYKNLGPEPKYVPVLSVAAQKLFESFLFAEPGEALKNARSDLGFDPKFQMIMYLERRFSLSAALKAFCITAKGRMALMPPLVESGDTLVHVRGGYMPIILRKTATGERRAKLVGACIVQDVGDVYFGTGWEDWLLE
jgi:hypothetical protein